ncbi:MAG TPA: DMT family transporter [Gaiellales bacterium]|nr:DMT family transporter [Gaiellales bacterium]
MDENRAPVWVGPILSVSVICAGVGASVVTTTRALVGGLVMLPVLRLVGAGLPRGARAWAWAGAISIGNVVLTLAGIAEGTRLAGAAVASVLLNSAPFYVALGARIWLREHMTRRQVAGLVVGFGGIVLIVASQGGSSGSSVAAGIVVCMTGALGWAAAGLAMRHLSTRTPGFDVYGATTAQFLCGGVLPDSVSAAHLSGIGSVTAPPPA